MNFCVDISFIVCARSSTYLSKFSCGVLFSRRSGNGFVDAKKVCDYLS